MIGSVNTNVAIVLIFLVVSLARSEDPGVNSSEKSADNGNVAAANKGTVPFRTIANSAQSEDDGVFYVCPPPTGATVLRLEPPRQCPDYKTGKNFTEGIAVIFKENISPYKFKATLYYKNVVTTTTWSGTTYRQITNRYADRVPVQTDEITDLIDKKGKCLSKARYRRNNAWVESYDKDEAVREVDLKASRFNTPDSRAWHTTNDTYTVFGSPWVYRTGTSVNCIVEEVEARSVYPYDHFGLSTGDIVEMSAFYGYTGDSPKEHTSYSNERFRQFEGYRRIDLDTHKTSDSTTRNFLTTEKYTVAWDWVSKKSRVCSMSKWQEVDEMMRAEFDDGKFRFEARSLSATFISKTTQFDMNQVYLGQCVSTDSSAAIDAIYKTKYADTHIRVGQPQTYLAIGGFIIVYQPLISNNLADMYIKEIVRDGRTDIQNLFARGGNGRPFARSDNSTVSGRNNGRGRSSTSRSRGKRDIDTTSTGNNTIIKTTTTVHFAMLQFTYDHIQRHVNEMLGRIAKAWCELQNRESVLWREMRKINPNAIASTMLGRRVGARMLGDVMAVSSCVEIDSTQVNLQNSMNVPGKPSTCYSRPIVTFTIGNDTEGIIEGQLGENNELLPTRDHLEPCSANHRRYFMYGSFYVYFENYQFVKQVDSADIQMVSTFVDLNLTMLEDREILPLTVYTREELRDTGVLDYDEVQRRNQMHSLRFYDIDKVVNTDNNMIFMEGLANFFQGLGEAGQAIGKVVVGAAGAIVSTVSGVASFLSNPFGALAIGLLVLAGLVAAFLAFRYVNKIRSNPMKALYPLTTKSLKQSGSGKGSEGDDFDDEEFDEKKLEQAREMVKYLSLLSASERVEHKAKRKGKTSALLTAKLANMALRSRKQPKYSKLENSDTDSDEGDFV
ncbi:envelope glycoprotein B [Spheniscid alphaherpesvirus 1]|uniref:Envelope glycoprotein B n=1 Tax=Spheniscid alphaherpesvirus 1 TaxID=2560777 RepID=A0A1R3T7V3_9ALPH|nr:envelope glycoprotein B [Spheniscid alphaherpesvirus 1]